MTGRGRGVGEMEGESDREQGTRTVLPIFSFPKTFLPNRFNGNSGSVGEPQ